MEGLLRFYLFLNNKFSIFKFLRKVDELFCRLIQKFAIDESSSRDNMDLFGATNSNGSLGASQAFLAAPVAD